MVETRARRSRSGRNYSSLANLVGPCWMTVVRLASSLCAARTVFRWSASAASWNGWGKFIPDNANKAYSVDQLAALSGLSGERIQELAQPSLLDERACRFGFRDLAIARQIAKLLADGVRLSEIIRSVNEIRKWLPDTGLGSMRLRPGPSHSLQVEQAGGPTDKRGQFMLAVDDCRHNPDDLFASAQAAEQAGDVAEAERLYRILMKTDPTDASAAFNLGDMLRACGRNVEAEAALQAATGSTLPLPRLGTISATYSTIRGGPRTPSNVYARACRERLTT